MASISLAQALHGLIGELDAEADALLRAEFQLTHSQLAFLMPLLNDRTIDVSTIASVNHVSPAAVSKRVEWFVQRGLITTSRSDTDGRRLLLSLTPAGRRLARRASARLAQRLEELLAGWPASSQRAFEVLVAEVADVIHRNRNFESRSA